MNVQDEIKALKERIAELEEQAKEKQEFPKLGDEYWYTDEFGTVCSYQSDEFFNKDIIEDMKDIGNIFKTKEQADLAVEKLKAEAELRKYSRTFKHGGDNYTLNFNHDEGKVVHVYASESHEELGSLYFESRDKAQQAINSIGEDRIKKYIFGVEE